MIQESQAVLPIWMLFSACIGFLVGEMCGDSSRHRKYLAQENDDLRNRLEAAAAESRPIHTAIKEQRSVVNDIHKQITAVTKTLLKRPS